MSNPDVAPAVAIEVRGVSKHFLLVTQFYLRHTPIRIGNRLRRAWRKLLFALKVRKVPVPPLAPPAAFQALKDVSFDIFPGEVLGIIGRNGSGKTTLLKILARVTAPSTGEINIRGTVAAMLGVGTGFHPLFTGRENIYMSGTLFGLSRKQIENRLEAIVEFAEVGAFIDEPVKNYSTGMRSRLGYAVSVELDPEILLLDEILAVGDMAFQRKCLLRMQESRQQGKTIVLVSHNMNAIKGYCDRVLLIEKGEVVRCGDPDDVVSYYLSNMFEQGSETTLADRKDRDGSGTLTIDRYWLEDALGRVVGNIVSGEECALCLHHHQNNDQTLGELEMAIVIKDANGRWLTRFSTEATRAKTELSSRDGVIRCVIPRLPMIAGTYSFSFRISAGGLLIDHLEDAGRITVTDGDFFGTGRNETHSPILVEHQWSVASRSADG